MASDKTQEEFFNQIKSSLPHNRSLVDEVAEALGLSNDSAYRRMRGETSLTLDEFRKLSSHFKATPAFLSAPADGAFFHYRYLNNNAQEFESYIRSLLENLRMVNSFEEKKIIMVAKDIPIFHWFQFPDFCAFKMFFWLKSILAVPEFDDKKFSPSLINPSILEMARMMAEIYIKIPSVEIWTDETVNTAVRQIEYYSESGFFEKKEDALALCGQLKDIIGHIQKQAEAGSKFLYGGKTRSEPDNYKLFYSDFIIANNTILAIAGSIRTVFLTHHTFNALITRDNKFCNETEQWMNTLEKKSILLSGMGEKKRNQYFGQMRERVEELEKKINSL